MEVRTTVILYITICIQQMVCQMRPFSVCQYNFDLKIVDGFLEEHTFPWLGFVQYVHEATERLRKDKAPRVVLVQKQFVLGTAVDLLRIPKSFKLGNVIFGEYEREESQCGLTVAQIKEGVKCTRSYLEIPIVKVIPHPEFSRFGSQNSLALGKLYRPVISSYMIPICLPTLSQRTKLRDRKIVYLVDYISTIPNDMGSERMAMKALKLYTHRDCVRHRPIDEIDDVDVTQVLCTSGCGVRQGAPIITNVSEPGRMELVGLAAGGGPCGDIKMRNRFNTEPPFYVDVYPYVSWIVNVITANHIPKAYPQNFKMVGGAYLAPKQKPFILINDTEPTGWSGRTFQTGYYCFQTWKKQKTETEFFYLEKFKVKPKKESKLEVIVQVFAGPECDIVCVRVLLPNRLITPVIKGIRTGNITMTFNATYSPPDFEFSMLLTGKNSTREDSFL